MPTIGKDGYIAWLAMYWRILPLSWFIALKNVTYMGVKDGGQLELHCWVEYSQDVTETLRCSYCCYATNWQFHSMT